MQNTFSWFYFISVHQTPAKAKQQELIWVKVQKGVWTVDDSSELWWLKKGRTLAPTDAWAACEHSVVGERGFMTLSIFVERKKIS